MELLDILDEEGNTTGETIDREVAHAKGIRHRTSHVWIFRKKDQNVQVLLQKRSKNKDSNPGCYDISSAGHIPAGASYEESAIRELQEELGICMKESDLVYCGYLDSFYKAMFHGKLFQDNQRSNVYGVWLDLEPYQMTLQHSEVEAVRWMDFEQCYENVKNKTLKSCIRLEELDLLRKMFI